MAGKVDEQAEKMRQEQARREQDKPTRRTIPPGDQSATAPNVRLSVYLAPAVAEALERVYHARRLEGERVSRSQLIEDLLRQALRDQGASGL